MHGCAPDSRHGLVPISLPQLGATPSPPAFLLGTVRSIGLEAPQRQSLRCVADDREGPLPLVNVPARARPRRDVSSVRRDFCSIVLCGRPESIMYYFKYCTLPWAVAEVCVRMSKHDVEAAHRDAMIGLSNVGTFG